MGLYDNIRKAAELQGKTISQIEGALSLPRSSIAKYNAHIPSADKIANIAQYLGVSMESLVSGKDNRITSFKSADDIELDNYIEMLKGLSPDRRRSIFEQIEFQTQKEANSQS